MAWQHEILYIENNNWYQTVRKKAPHNTLAQIK